MKKILFLSLCLCLLNIGYSQNTNVITEELQQIINTRANELTSINIVMKSQLDVERVNKHRMTFEDKSETKEFTLREFKDFAEQSQTDVLSILETQYRGNQVADIKCHWITNMIYCKATAEVIYKLAQHPDVATIMYDKTEYMLFNEESYPVDAVRGNTDNVIQVNADDVWAKGYTGKGVVVAVLDTGVNTDHVDLKDHLWDGGEEYPNHGINTFDGSNDVTDIHGHGTHCAGTICGDGTSGTHTGIAPDATLMCVKVFSDDGQGSLHTIADGVEFAVEHGANVISFSGGFSYPEPELSNVSRQIFKNVLTFDVITPIAAGNDGDKLTQFPVPRNISSPSDCPPPWIHPDQQLNAGGVTSVLSIGAVDKFDNPAVFSSEGPVTWEQTSYKDYIYSNPVDENCLYYDSNYVDKNTWNVRASEWGIMFPPASLEKYEGAELTKVSAYSNAFYFGVIEIYQGGDNPDEGTMIYEQSYESKGPMEYEDHILNKKVPIDHTKNLWIVLRTNADYMYPAAACDTTCDPNGRWMKIADEWMDNNDMGFNSTWRIRAYVENPSKDTIQEVNNKIGLIRPDICAPGVNIVSLNYDSNTGMARMDGTSMATPCVSGAIALMLEKNPELTPAEICKILETTAVKLSDKKNNKTGSGRIDVLAAINAIDDDEPINPDGVADKYDKNVDIYPNPVDDIVFININETIQKVNIYNVIGISVYSNDNCDGTIDISNLNDGMYLLKITTDDGDIVRRIFKN